MRNEFIACVVALNVAVFVVTAVPSRFLYRSEARFLIVFAVALGVCDLFAVRAINRWTPWRPMSAPWHGEPGNATHAFFQICFCAFVVLIVFSLIQGYLADESNPGGLFVQSPCGSSSCSSQEGIQTDVFNPLGFYTGGGLQYSDYRPTTCFYDPCAWADGNGQLVQGYNRTYVNGTATGIPDLSSPCGAPTCLTTGRAQDWPNPAIGGGAGYLPDFGISVLGQVTLCPGSYVSVSTPPAPNTIKGRVVCPYCLPFFAANYGYSSVATAYCPANYAVSPGYVCFPPQLYLDSY